MSMNFAQNSQKITRIKEDETRVEPLRNGAFRQPRKSNGLLKPLGPARSQRAILDNFKLIYGGQAARAIKQMNWLGCIRRVTSCACQSHGRENAVGTPTKTSKMLNTAVNSHTTILYVVKDKAAHVVETDALRKSGFRLREASTGRDALASANEKPDLILIDIDLPDLSGFEVCRRLKVDPRLAAIPVVLISGTFAGATERLQALASGADDYVIGPLEPVEFLKEIKSLLLVQGRAGSSEERAGSLSGSPQLEHNRS